MVNFVSNLSRNNGQCAQGGLVDSFTLYLLPTVLRQPFLCDGLERQMQNASPTLQKIKMRCDSVI